MFMISFLDGFAHNFGQLTRACMEHKSIPSLA